MSARRLRSLAGPGSRIAALALGLLVTALAPPAHAQFEETMGARAQAMGGTFVGFADDGYALFWNPGALSWVGHQELSATSSVGDFYAPTLGDKGLLYHFPITDYHALGLGWRHAGLSDDDLGFDSDLFVFGYGLRFGRRFGVGASARYLREAANLDGERVSDWSGWTGDLGFQYRSGDRWSAGVLLRNLNNLSVSHTQGQKERLAQNTQSWIAGMAFRPRSNLTLAAALDDRLHFGAEYAWQKAFALQGGVQRTVRSIYGESSDGNTYSLGASVRYFGFKLDVARLFPPVLPPTNRVSLGVEFQLSPSRVRVERAQLDPVFASYAKRYADKPVGKARLTSRADTPLATRLSLFVPGYMVAPTEKEVVLRPKETKEFDLNAIFSPDILRLAEDRPAQAELKVSYQNKSRTRTERARTQFFLYKPGAITWNDLRSAAAFVTTQDPAVSDFARELLKGADQGLLEGNLRNLYVAMRVFDALSAYGITYVPDPNNPFSRVSATRDAVDEVQYPRQLLASKTGDCDDTTVLYCSLLENLGVPTAFFDGPGHILMMFDSGIHPRNRLSLSVDEDLTVVRDDRVWIPVETTMIGKSFQAAWNEGAEIFRRWKDNPEARVALLSDGWAEYQPTLPLGDPPTIRMPDAGDVNRRTAADLDTLRGWQQTFLAVNYLEPLKKSQDLDRELDLGRLMAQEGRFNEAETKFLAVLRARPQDAIALNNLGNLDLLTGRPGEALARYRAARNTEDDPGVLLNEGLARWSMGDESGADSAFSEAVARLGDADKALALLGIATPNEAGRGARVQRLSAEEIRQRLRDAAARVPHTKPGSTAPTGTQGAAPVVSKVSGSRAADAQALARAVYWKKSGKETQP